MPKFQRIPQHVGIIPDGNRRWAQKNGLPKEAGYDKGIQPGLELYKICVQLGIKELTFYGFTQDNTKRPAAQKIAFQRACVDAVRLLSRYDGELFVAGNYDSPLFPKELKPFTKRKVLGKGLIKINFLVNYSWQWDFKNVLKTLAHYKEGTKSFHDLMGTRDISRIDLIVRWGGRRRLSGFLPVQSVYSDFYVVDELWPDFKPEHFFEALSWYDKQDITLGG